MTRLYLLVPVVVAVLMLGAVLGYNRWRQDVFREGYERGVFQTAAYIHRTQPFLRGAVEYPSAAWRDCAWHFVNTDEDSGWIEICQYKAAQQTREGSQ